MPKPQEWSLQYDDAGNVIQRVGETDFINLGPRDEVFTTWADFMGEEFINEVQGGVRGAGGWRGGWVMAWTPFSAEAIDLGVYPLRTCSAFFNRPHREAGR